MRKLDEDVVNAREHYARGMLHLEQVEEGRSGLDDPHVADLTRLAHAHFAAGVLCLGLAAADPTDPGGYELPGNPGSR